MNKHKGTGKKGFKALVRGGLAICGMALIGSIGGSDNQTVNAQPTIYTQKQTLYVQADNIRGRVELVGDLAGDRIETIQQNVLERQHKEDDINRQERIKDIVEEYRESLKEYIEAQRLTKEAEAEEQALQEEQAKWDTIYSNDFYAKGHTAPVQYTSAMEGYGTANILYQWDMLPNYYLAEYISPMGPVALSLTWGDEVYLYGQRYVVTHVEDHIPNDGTYDSFSHAQWVLSHYGADMAIQTCEYNYYDTPVRIIVLQYA